MKKLLYLLLAVSLFSCKDQKKDRNESTAQINEIRTDLYGSWVGEFEIEIRDKNQEVKEGTNRINIMIKKITADEVIGQSIVAGNNRPLKGEMIQTGNTIKFTLKEPGDDKNDGVFTFEIKNDSTLTGTWTAYNPKKEVTKRKYTLTKRDFKYDASVMLPEGEMYMDYVNARTVAPTAEDSTDTAEGEESEYEHSSTEYRIASDAVYTVNSSTKKLKESDLKNLRKIDLEILRNTIFARHGLTFKTKAARQYFTYVDWYIPISSNVDNELTSTEKQNIAILKRFEKYATDNYDTFGR